VFSAVSAQNIFIVDKVNGTQRNRFYEGKPIKFKTSDNREITGKINYISDTSIVVNELNYPLSEIREVYLTRKFFKFASYLGLMSAAAFLPANMITNLTHKRQIIGSDTYVIAAGTLGTFGICALFREKKMKIGSKYKVAIVRF
jgi:hypothetical protein